MIVTLTPLTDFAPVPRVEVGLLDEAFRWNGGGTTVEGPDDLDGGGPSSGGGGYDAGTAFTYVVDLPPSTDRVTLWRQSAGRWLKVRGAVSRSFASSFGILDLEAGRVDNAYEIECFNGATSLGRVPLGSVLLPHVGERYQAVVQQPLSPRLNVLVEELDIMVPSVTTNAPGELVYTEGSRFPSLVGFGPRRGLENVEVAFSAPTREFAAQLRATLGTDTQEQLPVWLIRSAHPLLPPVFFCEVRSLVEEGVNLHVGGTVSRFTARVTEVAPPAPALMESPLRYSDLMAVFPTYSALEAALPTYSQVNTAFEYAGAAGD